MIGSVLACGARLALALVVGASPLAPQGTPPAPSAQQRQTAPPAPKSIRLQKIDFVGLKRYDPAEIIRASGLRTGASVETTELERAAQRLADAGLFARIGYRYRSAADGAATVTFEVEEMSWTVPVVFDNLVWFTGEELRAAVRRDVPSFDGTAPEAGPVAERIAESLQKLLDERGIGGRIEYRPTVDPASGELLDHNYAITNVALRLCALEFPGASAISSAELVRNSQPLFAESYSQAIAAAFADATLLPLYRKRGHLRARFRDPAAAFVRGGANCPEGVALSVPVEEGVAYVWSGAEWSGVAALPAPELDRVLGMRAGEIADGLKLDEGLQAVRKAYGRRGHIAARLAPAPAFDDANRRVAYRIAVDEGAQFRMGELTIKGLSGSSAARVREGWRLAPGEVFDAQYADEFLRGIVPNSAIDLARRGGGFAVETAYKPDRERRVVDVVIEFK